MNVCWLVIHTVIWFIFLTIRFICLVQRAQYHTSRGSFTSLSVTWGLWQSWWYRLWHSWHSTNWFPMVTVICLVIAYTAGKSTKWTWQCISGFTFQDQSLSGVNVDQHKWFGKTWDVPANHTGQAHFHGKVISIGLIVVVYVRQEVFACLNGNWGGTILLFLQTRLFRRVHVSQLDPDLFVRRAERRMFGHVDISAISNNTICSHLINYS